MVSVGWQCAGQLMNGVQKFKKEGSLARLSSQLTHKRAPSVMWPAPPAASLVSLTEGDAASSSGFTSFGVGLSQPPIAAVYGRPRTRGT